MHLTQRYSSSLALEASSVTWLCQAWQGWGAAKSSCIAVMCAVLMPRGQKLRLWTIWLVSVSFGHISVAFIFSLKLSFNLEPAVSEERLFLLLLYHVNLPWSSLCPFPRVEIVFPLLIIYLLLPFIRHPRDCLQHDSKFKLLTAIFDYFCEVYNSSYCAIFGYLCGVYNSSYCLQSLIISV